MGAVLFLLARESRYTLAARRMADLCEYIDRHEPKNHALYFACAARPSLPPLPAPFPATARARRLYVNPPANRGRSSARGSGGTLLSNRLPASRVVRICVLYIVMRRVVLLVGDSGDAGDAAAR